MSKKTVVTLSLLGESQVGKTCLCGVYLGLEFQSDTLHTIGMEKLYTEMTMPDGNKVSIKIWDTAGQERFRSIALQSLRTSKGIAVVFDVTSKISFDKINYWLDEIKNVSVNIPIVLFGNKCDLENRQVSKEEAENYAKEKNILYFETSAKNNIGVKEGFEALAIKAYEKLGNSNNINIKIKNTKTKKKKKCCGGGESEKKK